MNVNRYCTFSNVIFVKLFFFLLLILSVLLVYISCVVSYKIYHEKIMAKSKTKTLKEAGGGGGGVRKGKPIRKPAAKSNTNFKTKNKKAFTKKTVKSKSGNVGSKSKVSGKETTDEPSKRKLDDNSLGEIKKKKKEKSELVTKLMSIYEILRRKDSAAAERTKLINDVIIIAKEKENEIALKHGTVRVLEMCVKYGTSEQRDKIFKIFKENIVNFLTSKYAKFLIEKFVEYGTKEQKKKIIEAFYGKLKKLIKNKEAKGILEEVYCKYANSSQRAALVEEFYGPEYTVFKVASGRSLDEILTNEPAKKETVLKSMKESLTAVCQKDSVSLSVIHRALLDYFKYASTAQKMELVEILKSAILNILHTKDGARVAINCLWNSTTKERKAIAKSFKTHVVKICTEEFGHMVMFALFDVMDDTVLLKKALFPEILTNIDTLLTDQYGRKVLLYILKPRASTCFLPEIVRFLQQGDDNPYSKKDTKVRQQELRDILLPDLLECMAKNVQDIVFNKSHAVALLSAIQVSQDLPDAVTLMEAIAKMAAKPLKSIEDDDVEKEEESDEEEDKDEETKKKNDTPKRKEPSVVKQHMVVDACGHWVIKNLVKQDKQRVEEKTENLFSSILCDNVPTGYFADWALHNRGAFVLVSLLETNIESVTGRVKDDLKFMKDNNDGIKGSNDNKGLEILKQLL